MAGGIAAHFGGSEVGDVKAAIDDADGAAEHVAPRRRSDATAGREGEPIAVPGTSALGIIDRRLRAEPSLQRRSAVTGRVVE